ncbi:hypothetical protein WDA40_19650 [Acinetobacter pittii]|uniref:hypothetical protein n=1 Tax=Acinetobacter pittii TaxID=48296 RepID=UPI00374EA5EC
MSATCTPALNGQRPRDLYPQIPSPRPTVGQKKKRWVIWLWFAHKADANLVGVRIPRLRKSNYPTHPSWMSG